MKQRGRAKTLQAQAKASGAGSRALQAPKQVLRRGGDKFKLREQVLRRYRFLGAAGAGSGSESKFQGARSGSRNCIWGAADTGATSRSNFQGATEAGSRSRIRFVAEAGAGSRSRFWVLGCCWGRLWLQEQVPGRCRSRFWLRGRFPGRYRGRFWLRGQVLGRDRGAGAAYAPGAGFGNINRDILVWARTYLCAAFFDTL